MMKIFFDDGLKAATNRAREREREILVVEEEDVERCVRVDLLSPSAPSRPLDCPL
jgi:hypothetical protein